LYIAGNSVHSLHAIANLNALCEAHFPQAHDLEIVDMLAHPHRALADGVLVTPTLLKLRPSPVQRIVGGLYDASLVLRVLEGK
jgi:circadian clock protein KaiB